MSPSKHSKPISRRQPKRRPSGSLSKPREEWTQSKKKWTQLSCGCLLIGNDGSKVTCREHTNPKLRETLAKSKVVRPLPIRELEVHVATLLRQQEQIERQIAEIKARLAILRENVNTLMTPKPFWGH